MFYPKYLNTLTPYRNYPKFEQDRFATCYYVRKLLREFQTVQTLREALPMSTHIIYFVEKLENTSFPAYLEICKTWHFNI